MDRRGFLKLVPKMAGVSALGLAAPAVLSPPQMQPPQVEALPPEDFLKVANEIVDTVNGKMKSMSEAEMRERASCSLKAYLEQYG